MQNKKVWRRLIELKVNEDENVNSEHIERAGGDVEFGLIGPTLDGEMLMASLTKTRLKIKGLDYLPTLRFARHVNSTESQISLSNDDEPVGNGVNIILEKVTSDLMFSKDKNRTGR